MRKIALDSEEIVRLYVEEHVSSPAIAARVGCGEGIIYRVLEESGVPRRARRARVPIQEAVQLYVQEGWPASRISEKFGVSRDTVARYLREAGVPLRSGTEARQPSGRRPCANSVVFRAYVLGLAWGDFWVRRHGKAGLTVSVSSSTTHAEQVAMIREVFGPFGPVYDWENLSFRASLDLSFWFLAEKYKGAVPGWVRGQEASAAFVAGYVDAEGSFGIYDGRARFKLDSYDVEVLSWLQRWCRAIGVRSRYRLIARAGDPRSDQGAFRKDLWRLNVNDGPSMLRFIATLEPYLRHERRRAGAQRACENIRRRLQGRIADRLEPLPLTYGAH
jgi:Homeodomain-like domain